MAQTPDASSRGSPAHRRRFAGCLAYHHRKIAVRLAPRGLCPDHRGHRQPAPGGGGQDHHARCVARTGDGSGLQGGTVSAHSNGPVRGALFRVRLPLVSARRNKHRRGSMKQTWRKANLLARMFDNLLDHRSDAAHDPRAQPAERRRQRTILWRLLRANYPGSARFSGVNSYS